MLVLCSEWAVWRIRSDSLLLLYMWTAYEFNCKKSQLKFFVRIRGTKAHQLLGERSRSFRAGDFEAGDGEREGVRRRVARLGLAERSLVLGGERLRERDRR
jgi:hypothetical protein